MIDLLLVAIIGVVTYCVASEGPWGAATSFIAVILGGLLAMNFFEPVAGMFPGGDWQVRADIIALLGLFAAAVTGLRMAAEKLMPTQIEVNPLLYDGGRWGFSFLTGYVTAAIVLTALHTAPLSKDLSLGFKPTQNNFFGIGGVDGAPDRMWLAFTQYVSENIFTTGNVFDRSEFPRYRGKPPEVWSSFPIRYADRRERWASGGAATSAAAGPATSAPPVQTTPGGGSSGAKF